MNALVVLAGSITVVMVVSAVATIAGALYALVKDRERRWAR